MISRSLRRGVGRPSVARDFSACVAATLVALSSEPAPAADWLITPRLSLRETYTDNVRLARPGQEQSDLVTEVEPGISIRGQGARLQVSLDYAFQYRFYVDNSRANGHSHQLSSTALLDAWEKRLFVEAAASISQQDISPLRSTSQSNVNITGNRTDVRTAMLSPYWTSNLGTWASVLARYTLSRTEYSGVRDANTDTQALIVGVRNGPAFDDFGWSIDYSRQYIESTTGRLSERELETITATARYLLFPTFALVGSVGYEDNSYGDTQGSISGRFWNAGFEWAPSTRTQLKATFGRRYFGDTYLLDFAHRTRLTTWTLGYSEQVVATPSQLTVPTTVSTVAALDRLLVADFPDPIQRAEAASALAVALGLPPTLVTPVNFLSNQVSLSKRLHGGFGIRGHRGTALFNFFREKRTREDVGVVSSFLGDDPFATSRVVNQTGYTATLSWRFTERTSGSLLQSLSRTRLVDAGREDTTNIFRVGVTHQLQPKVHGGLSYRFTERDSKGGFSYRENAVLATLNLQF